MIGRTQNSHKAKMGQGIVCANPGEVVRPNLAHHLF